MNKTLIITLLLTLVSCGKDSNSNDLVIEQLQQKKLPRQQEDSQQEDENFRRSQQMLEEFTQNIYGTWKKEADLTKIYDFERSGRYESIVSITPCETKPSEFDRDAVFCLHFTGNLKYIPRPFSYLDWILFKEQDNFSDERSIDKTLYLEAHSYEEEDNNIIQYLLITVIKGSNGELTTSPSHHYYSNHLTWDKNTKEFELNSLHGGNVMSMSYTETHLNGMTETKSYTSDRLELTLAPESPNGTLLMLYPMQWIENCNDAVISDYDSFIFQKMD